MMKFIILALVIIVSAAGYFAVQEQRKAVDETQLPIEFLE